MEEIWKPVPGYGGEYEISSTGRFRSGKKGPLKTTDNGKGYLYVRIGKHYRTYVHRLVAEVFIGDPTGLDINHKNGVKHDNRVENLELLTHSQNLKHAYAEGLHPGPTPRKTPVVAELNGEHVARFHSIEEASGAAGVKPCTLCNALAGRAKTCGGFRWRHEKQER